MEKNRTDAARAETGRINRSLTRAVQAGDLTIGAGSPIAIQSMCATHTQDVKATLQQIEQLCEHGADLVRVAVDSDRDVEALKQIRSGTPARLVVDLQENYRLAGKVAPFVQKIRYNPGHLHHHEKEVPVKDKVRLIVESARANGCALRIGVNFGSLDPAFGDRRHDPREAALGSVRQHVALLEELDFRNFVVSLKSADPQDVVEINTCFAREFPHIPLHLGVTEAGLLPMGEVKSRQALEPLLAAGIGDTLRVSLTLPREVKFQELTVAKRIIADVQAGRTGLYTAGADGLNIVSCPGCSRVENSSFVQLAEKVRELTAFAAKEKVTIAVMGCRVNGPGESDGADLGLWCAANHVNLKRKGQLLGAFPYEEVLERLKSELEQIISEKHFPG